MGLLRIFSKSTVIETTGHGLPCPLSAVIEKGQVVSEVASIPIVSVLDRQVGFWAKKMWQAYVLRTPTFQVRIP
jgi:G3E family GTPase